MRKVSGVIMIVSSFAITLATLFMLAAFEYNTLRDASIYTFLVVSSIGILSAIVLAIYDINKL
jgi:hypothetical protein